MDWLDRVRVGALGIICVGAVLYFVRPKRFVTKATEKPDNWQGPPD